MKPAARFARVTFDGPPKTRAWRIYCTPCGGQLDRPDDRQNISTAQRDRWFTERGWLVGRKRHVCPACQAPEAPRSAPQSQNRSSEEEAMTADPPREPTREDNRIIHDAIDASWDHERGLYRGACSDDEVGRAVERPRDWVRRVREAFFGAADACVSRVDGLASLSSLERRAQELEERAMSVAAEAEDLKREVAAARKAAGV
jgi:hypothetical protein